jgi:hypothetical protein
LTLLFPLATLVVGVPVAFAIRSVIELLGWLL